MHYRLIIACPDRPGIVAAVSSFISQRQGSILEANHHSDLAIQWFFMRHEIEIPISQADFIKEFSPIAASFNMDWQLQPVKQLKKVIILVSKQDHCLTDLLYRWRSQELHFELQAVISNHLDCQALVEWHKVPYYHLPVNKENKHSAFQQLENLFKEYKTEVIVLARYMQILSPILCQTYYGKIINIHHSFLPSFIGARPYHQAFDRGVKLIGATCHYVTEELDAGPIIEQDVIRINHGDTVQDMIRHGKDVEKWVLARGLRYHLEDRVLIHGNKTVVFATGS